MIEKFNGIFYLIVFLVHFIIFATYAYQTVFATKKFLDKFGIDDTGAGMTRFFGSLFIGAVVMDHTGNCGSVAFLQNIKHPVSVARKVMEDTKHVMLVGEGARQFAISKGFQEIDLLTEESKKAWEKWKVW